MANDSKTEKATSKKRRDERKKGNTFMSKDIVSAVALFIIFMYLKKVFPYMYETMEAFIQKFMNYAGSVDEISTEFLTQIFVDSVIQFSIVAMPLLLISTVTAVVASGAQTRFLVAYDSMKFKFSRLNPLSGIKRMFSLRSVVELTKNILKILIISYVLYSFVIDRLADFFKLYTMGLMQSSVFLLESLVSLSINAISIFVIIAGFDLFYQWWDYEKNIRMTKQEVKEEYKQMEGDPQMKGKIKQKQREMAFNRMMQSVPNADVVIRNPTHFAVALRYDLEKDVAPIVLAKGRDELALRIIDVATAADVHILEDRPLARALYASVEVGQLVPPDYYGVVAEILALVYSIKKKD